MLNKWLAKFTQYVEIHNLILHLNTFKEPISLISSGISCHILGAKFEMVSEPYLTVLISLVIGNKGFSLVKIIPFN